MILSYLLVYFLLTNWFQLFGNEGGFLYKILLVDDSDLSRKIVKSTLVQNGYEVLCASNSFEAIEYARTVDAIDLVLMDIELENGNDGIDAAKEILKIKNVPITFLTANSSKEILEKIDGVGNYGYISKGIEKYAFLSSVNTSINLFNSVSEAKFYQEVYDNANEEIYIIGLDNYEILSTNKLACKNLMLSELELKEKTISEIIPDIYDDFKDMINNLLNGMSEIKFYHQNIRNDGSRYYTENKLSLFSFKNRHIAVLVTIDISEKKLLEEENEINKKRLASIIEGIPSPAILISNDKIVRFQNKAASLNFNTQEGLKLTDEIWIDKSEIANINFRNNFDYFFVENENLFKENNFNKELIYNGKHWNLSIIELGEDYLYYFVDVTDYKSMQFKLYELAIKDELTGAYNRRFFINKFYEEAERVKRSSRVFSVIIFDIDDFKYINDKFGHIAGDNVLKSMISNINNRLRKIDILARWGGEEFVILLPETSIENAYLVANELRQLVSEINIDYIDNFTISLGISEYKINDEIDDVIKKADQKMYEAKLSGKNCVRY